MKKWKPLAVLELLGVGAGILINEALPNLTNVDWALQMLVLVLIFNGVYFPELREAIFGRPNPIGPEPKPEPKPVSTPTPVLSTSSSKLRSVASKHPTAKQLQDEFSGLMSVQRDRRLAKYKGMAMSVQITVTDVKDHAPFDYFTISGNDADNVHVSCRFPSEKERDVLLVRENDKLVISGELFFCWRVSGLSRRLRYRNIKAPRLALDGGVA